MLSQPTGQRPFFRWALAKSSPHRYIGGADMIKVVVLRDEPDRLGRPDQRLQDDDLARAFMEYKKNYKGMRAK